MPQVLFTWHGGETLMRPLSFYKKAMELQKKYRRRTIDNCIQITSTLLTDEWCEFFRENNFLVGISIDGPQEFHGSIGRIDGTAIICEGDAWYQLVEKSMGWNGMPWQW